MAKPQKKLDLSDFNLEEIALELEERTVSVDDAAGEVGINPMYLRKLIKEEKVKPKTLSVFNRLRIARSSIDVIVVQRAEAAAIKASAREAAKAEKAEKDAKSTGGIKVTLTALRAKAKGAGIKISGRNKGELAAALTEANVDFLPSDVDVPTLDIDLNANDVPEVLLDL